MVIDVRSSAFDPHPPTLIPLARMATKGRPRVLRPTSVGYCCLKPPGDGLTVSSRLGPSRNAYNPVVGLGEVAFVPPSHSVQVAFSFDLRLFTT